MNIYLTIFLTVFLAELGDKTQIATLLFASDKQTNPLMVFGAASAALIVSTGLAVMLGAGVEKYLSFLPLKLLAGVGFVLIGIALIIGHMKAGLTT